MEGTNLMRAAAHMRLKRSQDGLAIPAGKDLRACLESARVVARYFLLELGLSPEIAALQNGDWHDDLYIAGARGDVSQPGYPTLAIDDLFLFPYDNRHHHWCVVSPVWVNIPDVIDDSDRELVQPMYIITRFKADQTRRQPLYEAMLLAIQMHVMENMRRDLQGIVKDYLEESLQPAGDNLTIETARLVLPAMRLLLNDLPCLKTRGEEKLQTSVGRDDVAVETPSLRFCWTHASGIWRVWYRDHLNWQEIDPLGQTPPPAPQLLARRDFTAVFLRAAPLILARKIKEIELPLLLNKTWSTSSGR